MYDKYLREPGIDTSTFTHVRVDHNPNALVTPFGIHVKPQNVQLAHGWANRRLSVAVRPNTMPQNESTSEPRWKRALSRLDNMEKDEMHLSVQVQRPFTLITCFARVEEDSDSASSDGDGTGGAAAGGP